MLKVQELKQKRAGVLKDARALLDQADGEQRALTADEEKRYGELTAEADKLKSEIERREKLEAEEAALEAVEPRLSSQLPGRHGDAISTRDAISTPMINRLPLGDSEARMLAHYIRTGDVSRELRSSNATDMNIGTSGDGGYTVPTGHYNQIIGRRDTISLVGPLGCTRIPGIGTTVNVATDTAAVSQFVSTAETTAFDEDAPVFGVAALTLVKYTKKCVLSYELLEDTDSNLMAFLSDWVGRAYAFTLNYLLVTEALANGTSVTAGSTTPTAGDVQKIVYGVPGEYLDNGAWIMKRATEAAFRSLAGSDWQYAPAVQQGMANTIRGNQGTLWGYPVFNCSSVPAATAGLKFAIFGNFAYMAYREAPSLTFLRDPYSAAGTGQVNLFYYIRTVFKVLVAEAIAYGKQTT